MNGETKIAIFTIVNKEHVFTEFKENLSSQKNVIYQLIKINNCNGEYDSARSAFNENTCIDNVTYYVFAHPDVRFTDEYALSDIVSIIDTIGDFGVVGVAGARKSGNKREIVSTIFQGEQKDRIGTPIKEPTEVQTVDECFFVVQKAYFENHIFSNRKGWHLYGVEYCLEAIRNGKKNYAVPGRLWHISPGNSLDEKYMSQLEDIIQMYKKEYSMICTTVKGWHTRGVASFMYRKYYWIKQRIKRMVVQR